jgi:hypothetical protein
VADADCFCHLKTQGSGEYRKSMICAREMVSAYSSGSKMRKQKTPMSNCEPARHAAMLNTTAKTILIDFITIYGTSSCHVRMGTCGTVVKVSAHACTRNHETAVGCAHCPRIYRNSLSKTLKHFITILSTFYGGCILYRRVSPFLFLYRFFLV